MWHGRLVSESKPTDPRAALADRRVANARHALRSAMDFTDRTRDLVSRAESALAEQAPLLARALVCEAEAFDNLAEAISIARDTGAEVDQ